MLLIALILTGRYLHGKTMHDTVRYQVEQGSQYMFREDL